MNTERAIDRALAHIVLELRDQWSKEPA